MTKERNSEHASFAHIGDTHIFAGADHFDRVQRLFQDLRLRQDILDFVVHTGDIAGRNQVDSCGTAEDYAIFARLRSLLSVPIYPVPGNHDDPRWIAVPPSARMLTADITRCCYEFDHGSIRAVVLDARVGTGPESHLPLEQLERLRQMLRTARGRLCVFMHFPPIPLGTTWLDELMIMENGAELHATLSKYAAMIAGFFVGHVHVPFSAMRDGVLYVGCGSPAWTFSLEPGAAPFHSSDRGPIVWNLVTVDDASVIVRPQVVPS